MTNTSEIYGEIFHYTNWSGLLGILSSNSLWATHYKFLNDSSEIQLFIKEKFPELLRPHIYKKYSSLVENDDELKSRLIEAGESLDKIVDSDVMVAINSLSDPLKEQIYITSFCGEHKESQQYYNEHGLLSQWRAYGADGGFAIVLDTAKIEELLAREHDDHAYGYCSIGDIVYSHDQLKMDEEFSESINDVVSFFDKLVDRLYFQDRDTEPEENVYASFLNCITRYKHRGFSEENEVRIVLHLLPNTPEFMDSEERPQKTISYRNKNGEQAPYIELFDKSDLSLPIKRIIVGPHREKETRAAYLRTKLRNTDIKVDVSDIPYIGL